MAQVMMPQKSDPLDQIAKGLGIARNVFGIYSDYKTLQRYGKQEDLEEKEAQGYVSPKEQRELAAKGVQFSQEPIEGSLQVKIGGEGEELQTRYLKMPEKEKGLKLPDPKQRTYYDAASGSKMGIQEYYDKDTNSFVQVGEPYVIDPAKKEKTDDGPKAPPLFGEAKKLRDEYIKLSGNTRERLDAFQVVEATATNPNPTPATDLSTVFAFMKMVDPGSVVRESEYATAENARGVPETIRNLYNKVLEGNRLTPEQRAAFYGEAQNIARSALKQQKYVDDRYSELATMSNVDPRFVVDPSYQNMAAKFTTQTQTQPLANQSGGMSFPGVTPQAQAQPMPAPAPAPHPQDNEALQWAKQNPNDPRAKAILQANGVQ